MSSGNQSRFASPNAVATSEGWTLERLTPPSRLHGTNGLRTGAGETKMDGLDKPERIVVRGDRLLILDVGAQCLVECGLSGESRRILATGLPVGAPAAVVPKHLAGCGDPAGPMVNFTGLAAGPDGTLYIAAVGDGSTLALRPE